MALLVLHFFVLEKESCYVKSVLGKKSVTCRILKFESNIHILYFVSEHKVQQLVQETMSKNGTTKNHHPFNAAFRQEFFRLAPIYESVYTFPTSDLACTRTTSKIASPKVKTSRTAKLPYEELKDSSKVSATLLQEKQSSGKKKALDKQLLVEHANFMKRSNEKQNREEQAASEIQRYMRGFVVRQRMNPKQFEAAVY